MKRRRETRTEREQAKERGRSLRGRKRAGRGAKHRTVFCPGCRNHLPYIEPIQSPPVVCGGCGYRLRCANCSSDISTHEGRYSDGDPEPNPVECPVCGKPADGSDEAITPEEENFTWGDG